LKTIIIISLLIVFSACSDVNQPNNKQNDNAEKTPGGKIVAKIGSDYITEQQLHDSISALPVKQKILVQSSPNKMNKYIESYINKEVLYREALNRGFGQKENIKKSIEEYTKKVLIKNLTEQILKQEISEKEIEEYYDKNKDKYKTALVTQVSITPKDRENHDRRDLENVLNSIRAQLEKGGSLEQFNKTNLYSVKIRRSFKVNKGKYNKILSDAIFNMNIGEVSQPIKLNYSYVIFKILNGPSFIPFKNVKNNIKSAIRNNNFNNYLNNLKDSAGIEIYTDNINKEINKNAQN
jgi:hypothetical protein